MCGIAGIFHTNGKKISKNNLIRMMQIIAHRGPDGKGFYFDHNLAFGHRRLAILDLTETGRQPMQSDDGQVIVTYNGEIYNFRELRAALEEKGHWFRSRTDTEVLIHAYEQEGIDFVKKLNGMFAFALWDKRIRRLYLVRDRFGIKPLYWWFDGNTLVFASEIKSLLTHPKIETKLNPDALNEYFTFQNLFRHETLFQGVNLVQAAGIRWIDENQTELNRRCYWDYDFSKRDETMTLQDAEEETARLLAKAVERQLISDVPVGSYLSGGMDSSSLVALASRHIPSLSTFTCGFHMHGVAGAESNFDERKEAELSAKAFGTEHFEMVINSTDITRSLPKVVYHLEDLRLGMSYPNYYISRLASKFVKVCLSGGGGDELYAGYPWRYYRVFRCIDREDFFREYYAYWQRLVPDCEKPELFTPSIWKSIAGQDTFQIFRRVFTFNDNLCYNTPEDHVANSLYFECKTFLHGLFVIGDRLAMANGLEERFPFVDNDLVDFTQRIPIRYKLRNLENMKRIDENELLKLRKYQQQYDDGKYVLRQAMNRLIPPQILSRKKQGFSSPEESWFRGQNLPYVKDTLLNPKAASRDYLQPSYVRRIVNEHTQGNQNYRLLIWSLLCFEWWCKIFLEKYSV